MVRALSSALMVLVLSIGLSVSADAAGVRDFITRFYQVILERTPATTEVDGWEAGFNDGSQTGASLARGFVLSQEYINRNRTNAEFVNDLYAAFFNRAADQGGFDQWLAYLDAGRDRVDVLFGFIFAQEYINLAATFGISVADANLSREANLRNFIIRLYENCLGRQADAGGMTAYYNALTNGANGEAYPGGLGAPDAADNFVWSPEFVNRAVSTADFIRIMYRAFLNREPAQSEVDAWLATYTNGTNSLRDIMAGFTGSVEFAALAATAQVPTTSTRTGADPYTITGTVEDDGTAVPGNVVELYFPFNGGALTLLDRKLTDASGNFDFTTRPTDALVSHQVVVAPAP